jgi:hypothetical protein
VKCRGGRLSISREQGSHLYLALVAIAVFSYTGCGGGNSSTPGRGSSPTITSVSVIGPGYAQAGLCASFTATVSGVGNFQRSVQWLVAGVAGGTAESGLISTSGTYCAPAQPPADNPVSISAVANGDPSKSGSTTTRIVAITITPTRAQLYVGATEQFSATISGATSSSVTWLVSGVAGGNSTVGTISATGLYTAPRQVSSLAISVQAASFEAPSVYANADLSVLGQIVISPQNPQVSVGATQQFTATILGANDPQVTWRATYGAISPSGLYTAAAAQSPDTVTAWSAHANGSTSVQVLGVRPNITSISPQPATVLDQITINGTNLNGVVTAAFSDAIGGQIAVTGTNATGSSVIVTVPQGSVTGSFHVVIRQGGLAPVASNTLQFQRLARLRIRTSRKDLSSGESVTMQYALMGDATPRTVNFSADVGSFSGATYLAPGNVGTDTFAHVTGCIAGTQSCDSMVIALHPFRIDPDVPLVGIGQSLQLEAVLGGGATGANWNLLAGGGSLTSNGLYSAGTNSRTVVQRWSPLLRLALPSRDRSA